MSTPRIVKLLLQMPEEELEELEQLARERDLTVTDTLRQAVQTERFFRDSLRKGSSSCCGSLTGRTSVSSCSDPR